jgi:hypothetical protein
MLTRLIPQVRQKVTRRILATFAPSGRRFPAGIAEFAPLRAGVASTVPRQMPPVGALIGDLIENAFEDDEKLL